MTLRYRLFGEPGNLGEFLEIAKKGDSPDVCIHINPIVSRFTGDVKRYEMIVDGWGFRYMERKTIIPATFLGERNIMDSVDTLKKIKKDAVGVGQKIRDEGFAVYIGANTLEFMESHYCHD